MDGFCRENLQETMGVFHGFFMGFTWFLHGFYKVFTSKYRA